MTGSTSRHRPSTARNKPGQVEKPAGAELDPARADAAPEDAPFLRKKDLVERIITQSGLKKKDVKPVLEATLAVLGEALSNGERMNLPPFGKLTVNRRRALENGEVLITRIRRVPHSVEEDRKDPLADPDQ
jgi:nucleoid DNA-binding protein